MGVTGEEAKGTRALSANAPANPRHGSQAGNFFKFHLLHLRLFIRIYRILVDMAQSKATKKFEKNHLKDALERRKGLKKVKQKQQLKAKKKARRTEENGGAEAEAEQRAVTNGAAKSSKNAFADMSVDEFFQGGFDIPELPKQKSSKRKRKEVDAGDEDSSDASSLLEEPVAVGSDSEGDSDEEALDHQQQLDALAENDPEFHKYLQENEPELLGGDLAEIGELSDADVEGPKRKKRKADSDAGSDDELVGGGKNELDKKTVTQWERAMSDQHSLRAAREVVLAFRSAAHVSEDEEKEYKYSISSPEVYHMLLTVALKHIPTVLEHHLPVQQGKGGKMHVETGSKKFKNLAPLLRSQVTSIIHLLDNLSDAATLRLTLSSTVPLLPYLLSFKKLVRDIARAAATVWSTSSSTESTRIAAFLVLRRLITIGDSGIRENVLKAAYQSLVKGSRNTTIHTMAGVNLMKNSGSELWGLSAAAGDTVAYTTAFTFIRQLAVHLRSSITNNSNESYKTVYNWQYVHSLDFWSRVLGSYATDANSSLRPLIYPLVQVTLGALRLIPTATYFPLRFQLIRSLLRISLATGTYIPLAPALYEVLASAEMRRSPKASTLKPLDFATSLRAPKGYLRTRVYQDGIGEQVVELLSEFFVLWAKNIAFPELSLPVVVMLKRWLKEVNNRAPGRGNKNQKVNGAISVLVQKIEANARWIEDHRRKVEFAPNNRKEVEAFLKDVEVKKSPLGAYVVGQRKAREEKARVVEEGRREEERRREDEKKAKSGAGGDKMEADVDSEEESVEGSVIVDGDDDEDADGFDSEDEEDAVDGATDDEDEMSE